MTVWVHHDTSKKVGDKDHLKVFANENAADRRFQENDPECVAFQGSGVIRTSAKDPRPSSVN
jgi:hypothetical protein